MSARQGIVPAAALPSSTIAALFEAGRAAYRTPGATRAPMWSQTYHDAIDGLPVGDPRILEAGAAYGHGWDAEHARTIRDAARRARTRRHNRRAHRALTR